MTATSSQDGRRRVDAGSSDLAALIPSGFGASDQAGHVLPAQVLVICRAGGQGDQAAALVRAAVDRLDRQVQGAPQTLVVTARVENAGLGLVDVFLPGMLGFNVIQAGLILAASAFASYRTSGALRRVQATGIASGNLVLAHATVSLMLGIQPGLVDARRRRDHVPHPPRPGLDVPCHHARLPGLSRGRFRDQRLGHRRPAGTSPGYLNRDADDLHRSASASALLWAAGRREVCCRSRL